MMRRLNRIALAFLLAAAGCGENGPTERPVEESGDAALQRAVEAVALGKIDAADDAVTRAAALMPDSAEVRLVAGQVAYFKKDYAGARAAFKAIAAETDLPAALRADALVAWAVTELAEDQFDSSRLLLCRALRLNRRNPAVWYHLGMLSRNTYRFDEAALEQYEMAARLMDPSDARAKKLSHETIPAVRAAIAARAASKPGAAKRDAGKAAKLIAEAGALRKKKMIRQAIKKYEAALEADPFSYPAARAVGELVALNDKSARGVDKALAAYRTAIDQRPALQDNYYEAARLAYANKRWATAVAILNRALAHDPENVKALDLFIAAMRKAGKSRQAAAWESYRRDIR